jgi:uncharacterized protein YjbJ (UPF0337 family)
MNINQEQFRQSWSELKGALKTKWIKITDDDLREIDGDQMKFQTAIQARYGATNQEVSKWADRWYARWAGWYQGYEEAKTLSS